MEGIPPLAKRKIAEHKMHYSLVHSNRYQKIHVSSVCLTHLRCQTQGRDQMSTS